MQNRHKTKAQLVAELTLASQHATQLQQQITELENHLEVVARREQALMLERQAKTSLEAMYQAITALHSTLQYDQVLDHILDQLSQIVPHDAACILLTHGNLARVFRWHGYRRFGSENIISVLTLDITAAPHLQAMQQTGLPLLVPDVTGDDPWVSSSGQSWVNSYVGAPIRVRNRAIGFVNLDSATPNFFSERDAERLQAFLSHAVIALKNAWLYGEARREIMQRVKALKAERNFVWTVLDQAGALVVILDAEQRVIRFNQACEKITGYSLDEVKNKRIWELFTPLREQETVKAIFNKLVDGSVSLEYESEWLTREDRLCFIAWSSTILSDHHGKVEYIINTGHDITERRQIEEALRQGGERYALAVQAANDGLWDWNLDTDEIYFSSRWKTILGYAEGELQSRVEEWFNRVHPEDLARLKIDIGLYLDGATPNFHCEYRMRHRDGDYRWVLTQGVAVRDPEGKLYRLIGSQADITRRKKNEDQLIYASLHDALTTLPNRVLFMKHLERALERAEEDKDYRFAVFFLDLDRFKTVNDSLGHLVGDQLLITVARRLKASLRAGDIVARLAGDEFTILVEGIERTEAGLQVAQQLQRDLAVPVYLGGQILSPSASVGFALSSAGYTTPEAVLRAADATMYQAKARKRAPALSDNADFSEEGGAHQDQEAALRRAIERQELQLYYQPIVAVSSGQIVGVEALLRWHHPQWGFVEPDAFIPLAETSGLIVPIGRWALQAACRQTQVWRQAGYSSLRVSVNVSIRQFQRYGDEDLPAVVAAILQNTGLEAHALELEITETLPLTDDDFNRSIMDQLKQLGVQLALDDFGINSSLGLLRQFPIDTLKIDRSFTQEMVEDAGQGSIVVALVTMAHAFQVKVVAEGVETAAQLAYLQAQQCDEAQGYLFSPPISGEALTRLLQSGLS